MIDRTPSTAAGRTHLQWLLAGDDVFPEDALNAVLAIEDEAEASAYIVVEAETLHALDVEVERLKAAAALRGYARHVPMCSYRPTYLITDEATCDCGFDAVLEAYNAALEEPTDD